MSNSAESIPQVSGATLDVAEICRRALQASRALSRTSSEQRSRGLMLIADAIDSQSAQILAANEVDMKNAAEQGLASAMVDRLRLTPERVKSVSDTVREVAEMPDLIGQEISSSRRENGLLVSRVRIPLGVVAMIFESRPNVTSDAAALCLRSCNSVILRGGKEAIHSNLAICAAIRQGLVAAELPADAVQVFQTTDRAALLELLQQDESVDLVIPRGGEGLIRFVAEHSKIPVIMHFKGVCHVYVHEDADLKMACEIAVNAKVSRPGVCNSAETILVDSAIAERFVPMLTAAMNCAGVEMRGDEETQKWAQVPVSTAKEADWHAEYLDKIVAIRCVPDFDAAVEHIQNYGSNHTEAIITENESVSGQFLSVVHSGTVLVNASTRFADGGQLGLGAEIGISTTKLHAYGPMGAEGLTAVKFVVRGTGQVRK